MTAGARALRDDRLASAVSIAEHELVSAIMQDPGVIPRVREGSLSAADFRNPRLSALAAHLFELADEGLDISDLVGVAREAERRGRLERIGGAAFIAEVLDFAATSASAEVRARQVRIYAIEREEAALHSRAADGDRDDTTTRRLAALEAERAALEGATSQSLDLLGFTGDRLRRVAERHAVASPLPGLFDPLPSLHLVSGRPKTGKTRLGLHLAQSWACGVSPWKGAAALPGTRALVLSAEQSVQRVRTTLAQLADWNTEHRRDGWEDLLVIVARDRELPPVGRQLLTLDERGLGLLRRVLDQAGHEGKPFGFVLLDSLSRLKPRDAEENDNDAMTGLLDSLQAVSSELGVYALLIHHEPHAERTDPVGAARGASAISAVPQVLWRFAQSPEGAHRRELAIAGNEVERHTISFQVSPETDAGRVYYFEPTDPFAAYSIDSIIPAGAALSLSRVAQKLGGGDDKKRPSGTALARAKQLVAYWQAGGLVHLEPALRNGHPALVRRTS